jgi:hypothetical protein
MADFFYEYLKKIYEKANWPSFLPYVKNIIFKIQVLPANPNSRKPYTT